MKTAGVTLTNALAQSHSVKALPKLVAEWNLNRYYPVVADNTPSEDSDGFDLEMFPIESIYLPNRPNKGINKARVNEAKIYAGYTKPRQARFYVSDYDDTYKYWTSPLPSNPSTGALTNCAPYIVYGTKNATTGVVTYQNVSANKIVVVFENSWATPNAFTIEARISGVWTSVFTQANITDTNWEKTGRLALYYNGTTWRQNNPAAPTALRTNFTGVRVTVTSLKGGVQEDGSNTKYTTSAAPTTLVSTTGKNAHCNVIEISARREFDLSADLITVDDSFEIAESSNLYPIGTITSNIGNVSLWNGDNTYSNDNPNSPFAGLLEPNVEFRLQYIYEIGGVKQTPVDQFTMYTSGWASQKSETASIELTDYSKFFQSIFPRPAMWENLTVPEIISRVCDSIGFVNYDIPEHSSAASFRIPVFWITGEETVWELFDELAKASQTAIYFDALGVLRCKTREAAYDDTKTSDYSLRAVASGNNLANIVSADQTTNYEANKVKVTYQTTRWSDYNNGQPAMQKVWEPEGIVALRSCPLYRPMGTTDTYIYLTPAEGKIWPYVGKVNIDGEVIAYEGKEFVYYTYSGTTATRKVAIVKSFEEQQKLNDLTPLEYQYRNALTGALKIAVVDGVKQRGLWNSGIRAHPIDAAGYSVRRLINGVQQWTRVGFAQLPTLSRLQLLTNLGYTKEADILMASVGSPVDSGFWFYGTKVRFAKTANMIHQTAGIHFHNDGTMQENNYMVELSPSSRMTADVRKSRNELMLYTRHNGKSKTLATAVVAVTEGPDYEIDVSIKANAVTTAHDIKVWVNGKLMISKSVLGADRVATGGRFGVHARGRTHAQFQYLYALRRAEEVDPPDDFSFLDKKTGGFVGNKWEREWVYTTATKTRIVKKKSSKVLYKNNEKYFDEFGPYVHEIREFDVKFDPSPVLHSRPYSTNDWTAAVLEYQGNPFGAKFIMANVGRITSIVNGEDSLTFPGSSVEQILTVFGRALVIDEAKSKDFKHDLQVQRRGEIEAELTSPWIQSEAMADALGKWILKNMAYGNDEMEVEIFGNPLIEVTDVVDVTYPARDLTGQKYFVTAVKNTFDAGITTTLTLRRVNPAAV
jgi:hypothetical protein